ncbi:MAG: hypothetical protein R3Y23_05615 [Bacillota bacterium]
MIKFATDKSIELNINAKVNISLAIVGRNLTSYHKLDTVMAEIGICDTVRVSTREDSDINISYTTGESYKNDIALKMAEVIQSTFNTTGVDIVITKRIPEGCGVGGSSADAAGVARAMARLFDIVIDNNMLLSVGSDVPYMYVGGLKRVKDCGSCTEEVSLFPLYGVLIYKDELLVSTKEAFAMYDEIGGDNADIDAVIAGGKLSNALEHSALIIEPKIAELKQCLVDCGFSEVVMTGSGSGYIGASYDKNVYITALNKLINTQNDGFHIVEFQV